MQFIRRTVADASTYRRLAYLLSGIPLGLVWLVALLTGWSLCAGLVLTPLVIPVAIGLGFLTRGGALVEAGLARSLLGTPAQSSSPLAPGRGVRARLRTMFGAEFWRTQAYLLIRSFLGFPAGVAILSLIVGSVGLIFAPAWLPFLHDGAHLGFWRPHTFAQSLVLVPAGAVLLPASLLLVAPTAEGFAAMASGLLRREDAVPMVAGASAAGGAGRDARRGARDRRSALGVHASIDAVVLLGLTLIWAVTSRGYFWPVWVALPLAVVLGIHAWFVWLGEHPTVLARFGGSRALAGTGGVGGILTAYFVAVWAITGRGYFWPVWPMLATALVLGALSVTALLASPRRAEMEERIETLETTRAGAVDLQDTELRRIERDLHDGAQARLVALGMSLGMAEQKLADDPERVGELIAEARLGAEHALKELRDLARGIHPPVLADRGLEAALVSLASSTPITVDVEVELRQRPAPAVESASYFVAAEALANAAKHARADRVDIRIDDSGGTLALQVKDDGRGGADPGGTGLLGIRRRVEALDGTLSVTSPPGGPTTIRAEIPCES